MRYIGYAFTTALVVAGLCIGGWFAYWGLAGSSQDHRNHVNTHSQQYQAGLISQERDRAQSYDQLAAALAGTHDPAVKSADQSQQEQIKETFCQVFADLTEAPADLTQANARICQ
jgi:hypothetical protein